MKLYLATCILLGAANVALTDFQTLQSIAEEVNSLETTWKARTDFPTNTTAASYKMLLGARKSLHKPVYYSYMTPVEAISSIPEEFDARKHWPNCPTISHIRDQGHCGSCWAVSSASVFSDRLCIASKGQFVMPLSEEELLTCCDDCGYGCDGGSTMAAWNYLEYHGIVTGGDYKSLVGCQPYSISSKQKSLVSFTLLGHLNNSRTPVCVKQCTNPSYTHPFKYDHHKVLNSYHVPSTESAIQQEILAHGPVVGSFDVYSDFFTYNSGVYQQTTGTLSGRHAVRMIGWGTENGTSYWLIANSWSNDWGENGTFKIKRGKGGCGIDSEIIAGIPISA